jgi:hypothetical protein
MINQFDLEESPPKETHSKASHPPFSHSISLTSLIIFNLHLEKVQDKLLTPKDLAQFSPKGILLKPIITTTTTTRVFFKKYTY